MPAQAISRPTKQYCYKANSQFFLAVPAAYVSYWFMPNQYSEGYTWLICGVAGFIAVRCIIGGLIAFHHDYRLNYKYEIAQAPSNTAHDARFATTAEIEAAGCYDGIGRVIGIDLDGRPLFIPHRLRPAFSKITAGTGGGKTSSFCIPSCILSLFSAWD